MVRPSIHFANVRITINLVPLSFLLLVILATVAVVFLAPAETAEQVLTPAGIFAMLAQGLMRAAFEIERSGPVTVTTAKDPDDTKPGIGA